MAGKKFKVNKNINANETKEARFIRVVTPRINKAVKAIRVIGYCSGTAYSFTPEQTEQIVKILQTGINALVEQFSAKKSGVDEFAFME